jgi:hypothetical protein
MEPTAAEGWDRFCTRRNVTYNTIQEALGELLAAGDEGWVPQAALDRARALDVQRRSRR